MMNDEPNFPSAEGPVDEANQPALDLHALAHAEFGAVQRSFARFFIKGLDIVAEPLVYHPTPSSSTAFFLRSLPAITASRVLELGTGTGVIAIMLALEGNQVVATDIKGDVLRCARRNVVVNGAAVELRESDVFAAIAEHERFDVVLFNIPFFAKEIEHDFEVVGCDPGSSILRRFLAGLSSHLAPAGRGYLMHSNLSSPRVFAEGCVAHGLTRRLLAEDLDPQTRISRQLWELSVSARC